MFDFSKTWRENRQNMQYIVRKIGLFLRFRVVHALIRKDLFLKLIQYKYDGVL